MSIFSQRESLNKVVFSLVLAWAVCVCAVWEVFQPQNVVYSDKPCTTGWRAVMHMWFTVCYGCVIHCGSRLTITVTWIIEFTPFPNACCNEVLPLALLLHNLICSKFSSWLAENQKKGEKLKCTLSSCTTWIFTHTCRAKCSSKILLTQTQNVQVYVYIHTHIYIHSLSHWEHQLRRSALKGHSFQI